MASSLENQQSWPKKNDDDGDEDGGAALFPELLDFCSRAQTLICELLVLSDRIPSEFLDRRFEPVLFDLRYFDSPSVFESRIEGNAALESLEDQVRESCSDFLRRFFLLANGAILYYSELHRYLNDLQEGLSLQCTLDRVLNDEYNRQLLAETIQLFGCLLLLVEHRMSGFLREKFLIAYLRYNCCFDSPNINQICSFCRVHLSTCDILYDVNPFSLRSSMIIIGKPEDILARFPLPKSVVDAMICRLRNADLYDQVRHYPDPLHRTVALTLQARCMYILLLYSPEFLHDGFVMREIVDRFFKDHWVVPIFLHYAVDLFASWDAHKEAKSSLSSSHSPTIIRDRCHNHCKKVRHLLSEIDFVLSGGVLTEEYVLDKYQYLFSLVRDCNVTLRWLLLHRISIDRKFREIVTSVGHAEKVDEDSLLLLLLKTSQLEFELKELSAELLENKEPLWNEKKRHASDCIKELSGHLSGLWASSYKIKNESLKDWFGKLALEVSLLDHRKAGNSVKIIYRMISALKDISKSHQVEENVQVKKLLSEMEKCLQDMIKTLSLENDTLSTFDVITDAIYAWGYIPRFSVLLASKIDQDPSLILVLHMLFLKFRRWMDLPLLRIAQNESPDLFFVSKYYSSQFAAQICAAVDTMPLLLLGLFEEDGMQDQSFYSSNHIDKDKLQDLSQLDRQLKSGRAATKICIISQGIMAMSRNFFGLITLDLKDWFMEQMMKELKKNINDRLSSFCAPFNGSYGNLEGNLRTLSTYIHSQQKTTEILKDLFHMHGRSIWEEILTSTLRQAAHIVCTELIKQKQEPIPTSDLLNSLSKSGTFFGNLLLQILQLTDPSRSMFIEPMSGWFNAEGNELLGLLFFDVLDSWWILKSLNNEPTTASKLSFLNYSTLCLSTCNMLQCEHTVDHGLNFKMSIGQVGLCILDSLISFLVRNNLENTSRLFKSLLDGRNLEELHKMDYYLGPASSLPLLGWTSFKNMIKMVSGSWEPLVPCFATIGQLQLVRCLLAFKLRSTSKVKTGLIYSAVECLNTAIYLERNKTMETPNQKMDNNSSRRLFRAFNREQKLCGLFTPLQTKYVLKEPPVLLGRSASVISISQLSRYVLDPHLGTLTSRTKKSILDFSPVVIGIGTFLKQFHSSHMTQYVQYMGQYVRMTAEIANSGVNDPQILSDDPASEVLKSAFWLMYFCRYMSISKDLVNSNLSSSLVALLHL